LARSNDKRITYLQIFTIPLKKEENLELEIWDRELNKDHLVFRK
jgi:hypothetical protein